MKKKSFFSILVDGLEGMTAKKKVIVGWAALSWFMLCSIIGPFWVELVLLANALTSTYVVMKNVKIS